MRFTRIGSQRERRRKRTLRPRIQEYELDYMKLSRLSTRGGWGFPNLKSNSFELLPTFNNHQPAVIVTAGQRRTPVATDGQRARVVLRRRNCSDGGGGRRDICISDSVRVLRKRVTQKELRGTRVCRSTAEHRTISRQTHNTAAS